MQDIKISKSLQFLLNLSKAESVMTRRFDSRLGGGIGFSDFMILYHLSQAGSEGMRRTDLAEAIGLTASGVTRLLAPMEKIGLIKRLVDERDARVSYVAIAAGGRRLLTEKIEKAEMLSEELILPPRRSSMKEFSEILDEVIAG